MLLVGMTDRGWPSLGSRSDGVQRATFTGEIPFAVRTMRATPNGFRLTMTEAIDAKTVAADSFTMRSFTYKLHSPYGSPEVDVAEPKIMAVSVSEDGLVIDLVVDGLREGYVHDLEFPGLRSAAGNELSHERACYTLINRPDA